MERRQFLRRTTAVGALGLAGCISDENDDPSGTGGADGGDGDTPTETAPPTEMPTATPETVSVADRSIETVDSGCHSGGESGHSVQESEDSQTVTISGTIVTPTPCYEATFETLEYDADADTLTVVVGSDPDDSGACIECVGAVDYEATVSFEGGLPGSVDVSHDEPSPEGGEADGPSLRESSLSVIDVSESSSRTTADVEFDEDDNAVIVTGTIEGSDGCKTAALGRVKYNQSDDHLTVDVVTENREDAGDACTDAIVYIDYEATVSFEDEIPSNVSVQHDGQGVMSAAYGSSSASAPDREA
jgi:hypothetical protein